MDGTDNAAIGRRLDALRKAFAMDQQSFARFCGLEKNTFNNYIKGIRRPRLEEAGKIAAATGCGLNWIYHGRRADLPSDVAMKIFAAN